MDTNHTNEIDIRKIVRIVLDHWWWFAIGVVFCTLLGIAYYLRKSPKWTTDAAIALRQKDTKTSLDALTLLGISSNTAAEDEVVVLSSRGLLYQAIDALNLWDASAKRGGLRWEGEFRNPALSIDYIELHKKAQIEPFNVLVKRTKKGYKVQTKRGFFHRSTTRVESLDQPIETGIGTIRIHANRPLSPDTTYRVTHKRRELVVAGYQHDINISQYKKESNIIKLSTESAMPERDKALLHQLIEQYNLNAIVDKNLLATNTAAFIEERLAIITRELGEAEIALSDYKEQNKIADIGMQSQLFLSANSREQQAMAEIETQQSLIEYVDEFIRDDSKRNSLIPSNLGVNDPSLAAAMNEYNALQLQRMRILRTATDENPVIEQMNAQLASMRLNIIETISTVRESLKIRKNALEAQDTKYARQIKDAPQQERDYIRVVRQQQIKERLYVYLYEKREENALMLASTAMPAKIVDNPQRDVQSQNPKLKKLLIVCFVLGLGIPAVLLYLYLLFNNTIDDAKEYEQRIKAPMLGQLIQNSRNVHIAIHEGESTVSAELFRLVRTNLKYVLPPDTQNPVILVTSSINGEGKSYVSSNIALSLAILGKRVALVGLDIRKPMLAMYFGLKTKGHVTDFLAEPSVTVDDLIVHGVEHPNLDLLPCGTIPPNPAELLQSERLDELFATLRQRYDYIIVDTAPLALVSDTFHLDRVADMTIFVSRYKYTPTEMIDYINSIVDQQRMHHVACVLNGVKGLRAGYGYEAVKE